MNEHIHDAFDEISDKKIAEAAATRRRIPKGAIAAILLLALGAGILTPIIHYNNRNDPAPNGITTNAYALAFAVTPTLSPRPNEADYYDSDNWEEYEQAYDAWRADQNAQHDQPDGYADALESYFTSSIPTLLSGKENAVCSPVNIYMALAMLAETTQGTSREQILTLLGADDIESLREQAGQVWNAHYNDDGVSTLLLANSLWLSAQETYDMNTVRTLADSYYADVFQGTFGSSEYDTRLQTWLDEHTKGLLSDSAKNEKFDSDMVLALASTIYYRANWSDEFSKSNNIEDDFTAEDGTTRTVTYMCQTDTNSYYRGENFGAIKLSLMDGSKMWLVLPDADASVADVLEAGDATALVLANGADFSREYCTVKLRLPKFDICGKIDLMDALAQLGITDVADPAKADFSPILPETSARLDAATHSARVKIDEEGVEAAAYTLMLMEATGALEKPKEIEFYLDRPFLFYVMSRDDLPLFAGAVYEP